MSKSWPLVPFGDTLRRIERFEPRNDLIEYQFAGTYSFARGIFVSERKEGSTFALDKIQRIHEGDFVYCKIMAWEGAFGVVPSQAHNCVMSGAFVAYEINRAKIEPKYLEYYFKLESVWKSIGSQSTGTNVRRKSLHPDQFEKAEIPLPPLDEQRHIVAHIEVLAARIAEARGLRQQAVEEAEALLNARAREIVGSVNSELTSLVSWIDDARGGIQTGPFGAQLGSSDFTDSGHPVITIGNVQYSGLIRDRLKFVSAEKAQHLSRFFAQEGDILFARMGTVGRCCVVPKYADGWIFNYHIIRVAPDKRRVNPRYIHWNIQSSVDIEEYLKENIRGATREGVNSKIVGGLPFRVPSLDEQRRIVAYLDDLHARVDALKCLQAETAVELDALLPAVLDRAFRGSLSDIESV